MNNDLDNIKKMWSDAREINNNQLIDIGKTIALAEKKKKKTIKSYFITVLILMTTLFILLIYFNYVTTFRQLLSQTGIILMSGTIAIRLVIELYSINFSTKINLADIVLKTINTLEKFYKFRIKVHNRITTILLIIYSIGFYLLTPEFSRYLSLPLMIFIDSSYIILIAILIMIIRKAYLKEMIELNEIIRIHKDII